MFPFQVSDHLTNPDHKHSVMFHTLIWAPTQETFSKLILIWKFSILANHYWSSSRQNLELAQSILWACLRGSLLISFTEVREPTQIYGLQYFMGLASQAE